jgi:hypothetical protein
VTLTILAGAIFSTGQTVLLKKVFLSKLDFLIFLQLSARLTPNAIVCCRLLSFPVVVRHRILHAVVDRRRLGPPLPSSSAAAVFRCRSHHRHSAVSAVSCHPLSSFLVIVRCLILHAIVV